MSEQEMVSACGRCGDYENLEWFEGDFICGLCKRAALLASKFRRVEKEGTK